MNFIKKKLSMRYLPARLDNCYSRYANRREVLVDDYSSAGSEGTTVEDHPVCFALPMVCRKSSRSADNLNLSFQVHEKFSVCFTARYYRLWSC